MSMFHCEPVDDSNLCGSCEFHMEESGKQIILKGFTIWCIKHLERKSIDDGCPDWKRKVKGI